MRNITDGPFSHRLIKIIQDATSVTKVAIISTGLRLPVSRDVYPERKPNSVFVIIIKNVNNEACGELKLHESSRNFFPSAD